MNDTPFFSNFDSIMEAPAGIQLLRGLVLRLAVTGQLVKQSPDDGSAADLLATIADNTLVTHSNLTVPVAVSDQLWAVPESWRWARLKQVSDFATGRTPPTKDPSFWSATEGYSWVAIGDMPEGGEVHSTTRKVTERAVAKIFGCQPDPPGTLLMSFKLTIGKVARLGVPAFHNEAIISIATPFPEINEFLFRTLPLLAQGGSSKAAIKGATLNKTSLTNLLVPVPPLAEQQRIVAKLDEIIVLCDELERRLDARDRLRDLVAKQLVDSVGVSAAWSTDSSEIFLPAG